MNQKELKKIKKKIEWGVLAAIGAIDAEKNHVIRHITLGFG